MSGHKKMPILLDSTSNGMLKTRTMHNRFFKTPTRPASKNLCQEDKTSGIFHALRYVPTNG